MTQLTRVCLAEKVGSTKVRFNAAYATDDSYCNQRLIQQLLAVELPSLVPKSTAVSLISFCFFLFLKD